MNLNTKLSILQPLVIVSALTVALGMGIANAAGWLEVYGRPAGYPLAVVAIGCEVIAVLVLSASLQAGRKWLGFVVALCCAIVNVFGGHQFLDVHMQKNQAELSALILERQSFEQDAEAARLCVAEARKAGRSRTQNAARERLALQCQNDLEAARANLSRLPYPSEEPKTDGAILWALMILVEAIKILALFATTPAVAGSASSLTASARTLALRRHYPRDQKPQAQENLLSRAIRRYNAIAHPAI
jgi:hypothetical protein